MSRSIFKMCHILKCCVTKCAGSFSLLTVKSAQIVHETNEIIGFTSAQIVSRASVSTSVTRRSLSSCSVDASRGSSSHPHPRHEAAGSKGHCSSWGLKPQWPAMLARKEVTRLK